MTSQLNFLVKQDLWLAIEQPNFKILGWTITEPKSNNGHIKTNTALIFSHMYQDALNFVMIPSGAQYEKWTAEFLQKEIEYLTDEGALELIDTKEIVEAALAPGFPELTTGPILIRDSRSFEFKKEAILPRDLYVVMGERENNQSQGELVPGEKVSLRHILDVYTIAIGKKLISK